MPGSFEFAFSRNSLVLYKPVLDNMLNDPRGSVGTHLRTRGALIVLAAKRQVGVDTGALRQSIKMTHSRNGRGQYIWIGSENHIALAHHEGTRPHIITPRNHEVLRFSAGGRVIYSRVVMHPGTRPNRYLSDNLILVRV